MQIAYVQQVVTGHTQQVGIGQCILINNDVRSALANNVVRF